MTSVNLSERQLDLLKAVVEVMKADVSYATVEITTACKASDHADHDDRLTGPKSPSWRT